MKHVYEIEINHPSTRGVSLDYRYGNIREIQMLICKRGARIRFATNSAHDHSKMLTETDALVMDAIKKTCLLYALVNGESLSIRRVSVRLNGETIQTESFDNSHPLVYSMLSGDLGIQDAGLDDPVLLRQIANTPKSKNDQADAALMAYHVARTRTYRIERFIYLWMAINAVYALAVECAKEFMKTRKGKDISHTTEKDGLRLIAAVYNMEYPNIRKENEIRILGHAFSLAKRKDTNECLCILEATIRGERTNADNRECHEVRPGEFEEYDWLALMLLWLPYQLRCHYFHSQNTIPVFCYEDEKLLQGMAFVNTLLERFLLKELATWVTDEKRDNELKEKTQVTASNMVFGN